MRKSSKGRLVYHTTCRWCRQPKPRDTRRACEDCMLRGREGKRRRNEPGKALVRRLHELRLRASAGLPLFP